MEFDFAAGGMGAPPPEFIERMVASGVNPGEIMREVAMEMAYHTYGGEFGGTPPPEMVEAARAQMEAMGANVPPEMRQHFEAMMANPEMFSGAGPHEMGFTPPPGMETPYGGTGIDHTVAGGVVHDPTDTTARTADINTAVAENNANRQADSTTSSGEKTEHLGHDHNSDGISDHTHEIHTHSDGVTRHDHTAATQADALTGTVCNTCL